MSKYKLPVLICLGIVIFLCFNYTVNNQFTNWDDDFYVTNDPWIKALTPENLKVIFTEDITKNNYHPLCMLSLAINYHFSQLNPAPYYITNIVIHILNAILLFFLLTGLCRRLKVNENGQLFVATLGSLWFGIHPMHVESVAWIAERKDVLYCFFYIWALLAYLRYIDARKQQWYWITLLLFILSCLSKPMAVVLPMSLLCIDLLFSREQSDKPVVQGLMKIIVEKIPFFLVSLLCGGFAFYTQNKTGAVAAFGVLTIQERIMYAAYGFVMYVVKFFNPNPADLSTFYPYPYRYTTGYLPAIYYAAPFISMAILALPFVVKRFFKASYKPVLFGVGYLFANLVFVLQFISVGAAIMADRYSYVAYIGPMFLIPYLLWTWIEKKPSFKTPVYIVTGAYSLILCMFCYQRTFAWHDAESLLSDAIGKYPYRALLSYKWLGHYYFDKGEFDKALENYNVLLQLHVEDKKVREKVAAINAYREMGGANPVASPSAGLPVATEGQEPAGNFKPYLDSSFQFALKGDTLKAFRAYVMALRINRNIERLYADSSFKAVQAGNYQASNNQYAVLLKLYTGNPYYYFYHGVGLFGTGRMRQAMADWEIAVKMNAVEVQQSASYNLCVAYDSLGDAGKAVYYLEMAKAKGYNVAPEYAAKVYRKAGIKK